MPPTNPLYCKLYVDGDLDMAALAQAARGQMDPFGQVVLSPWGTLYVQRNPTFDQKISQSRENEFTSYRYCLDVMPVENTTAETYVADLERLVQSLVANGYRVTATYAEDK